MKFINNKGAVSIETTLGLSALIMIIFSMISVQIILKKDERKLAIVNTLVEKKIYFENTFNEQETFFYTMLSPVNANMNCLRTNSPCDANFVSESFIPENDRIVLFNNKGNPIYDGRSTNTRGYTETGLPCNTFTYNETGNDDCPIGYIISWRLDKANTGAEGNNITIMVKLVFNPSNEHPEKESIKALISKQAISPYDLEFKQPLIASGN